MALFKLEKLTIFAYREPARTGQDFTKFEAMFNPESFKRSYEVVYGRSQGVGSSGQTSIYSQTKPSNLNLKLILDGYGVHQLGVEQLDDLTTVHEKVEAFLELTTNMDGDTHEPHYLKVVWGELNFPCRLGSVDVNYTNFGRDGKALRAELDVTFISDTEAEKRLREENRNSPDLTHRRLVRSGDTLPLLSKAIYGSSEHYLFIANYNRLDDFRNLQPGQELFFPPLVKQ